MESNEDIISRPGEGDASQAPSPQLFDIPDEMDGHRLDYAVSRLLGLSRGYSQKLIKEGRVSLVPERRIKPSVKVAAADRLNIDVPPPEALGLEPEDVDFEVVYSDKDIIVVNKPAGLVVHPAPGHWTGTLVHGLLFRFPEMGNLNGVSRPGIVHRLDAGTSGLMVAARSGLAQEGLARDFKARRVYKEYLALCFGTPPSPKGTVLYPIGRDPYNKLKMSVSDGGRDARTDYSVIWSRNGFSFVRCVLHTGRTHQIRVHMAALRSPIVGDRLYAPSRMSPFLGDRIFLHSWKLAFRHPASGEEMSFRAPLPDELARYLKEIR